MTESDKNTVTSAYPPVVRIIDDDESVRRSIRYCFRVVGIDSEVYESADDYLSHDDNRYPGCLVLDLTMPGMNGLELQEEMIRRGIDLPVLFLSGNGDVPSVAQAFRNGAVDFLEKPFEPEALRRRVLELNEKNVAARAERKNIEEMRHRFDQLTKREKSVIVMVGRDMMNREIAEELSVQEHTVKVHRGSACMKLGVKTPLEIHALLVAIGELKN